MKQKNTNQKAQKQQPSPIIITNYTKDFDSFIEAINELRELDPEIKRILATDSNIDNEEYREADTTYAAARDVYTYFADIFPDIVERKNLHTSVTISATRVTLKTNSFFTIGWNFKYDKENKITNVKVNITTFTRENKMLLIDEVLKSNTSWKTDNKMD